MTARDMSPRTIAAAAGCLLVLAFAIPLWPQGLGGSTAYVVPRGASMEPKVSNGDLTFVRAQSAYRVGDVVAYRNTAVRRVVVHRIVAIDNGVYTLKGDANSFSDPEPVRRSQLVGRLAFSLPLLGGALLWLASPVNAVLLVALVALLARDRKQLLGAVRRSFGGTYSPAHPPAQAPEPSVDPRQQLHDNDRVVLISDMSFPHELAVAEVVGAGSMLRLADRYDRPVLYDEVNGELYVVESSMLFRCVLEAPAAVVAPNLAVVRDLVPVPEPVEVIPREIRPTADRERRHRWPSRREYNGRRKPSAQGRDWVYAAEK